MAALGSIHWVNFPYLTVQIRVLGPMHVNKSGIIQYPNLKEYSVYIKHLHTYSLLQNIMYGINLVNGNITNLNFTNPKIFSKKCQKDGKKVPSSNQKNPPIRTWIKHRIIEFLRVKKQHISSNSLALVRYGFPHPKRAID